MQSCHQRQVVRFVLSFTVVCLVAMNIAHGALSFNGAGSTVVFTHEVTDGGPSRTITTSGVAIPAGPGSIFGLPDDTLSQTFDPHVVDSRARAGFGQITTTFTGSGIVKPGTLITQVDPNDTSDEFASLTIDFDLKWDVTPPRYGPPIIGSFNVPVLAVVGTNGSARAEIIDMRWQKDTGGVITDVRPSADLSVSFDSGATLTALSVPPAAFVPFLLTPADDFLVNGTLKFSTKNADAPVFFYPELPSLTQLAADSDAFVHLEFNENSVGNTATGPVIDSITGLQVGLYNSAPNHVAGIPNDVTNSAAQFASTDTATVVLPSFQSFTVEAFIAASGANFLGNGIIAGEADDDSFLIQSINGTNQIQATIFNSSGNPFSLGPVAIPGLLTDFHHVALSFDHDSGDAALYIDGLLAASNNFVGLNRTGGFSLVSNIGQDFNGTIDEWMYYDFAKDPAFIEAINLLGQTDPAAFDRLVGALAGDSVPEPTTALLGLIGIASLAGRRRRKAA